jgi:hypothetical protein
MKTLQNPYAAAGPPRREVDAMIRLIVLGLLVAAFFASGSIGG